MITDEAYNQIWESIQDRESRDKFIDDHINVGIAFQINGIRRRQQLVQKQLAERLGITQPQISAWESPSYGKYTLQTLKDMAKAFDVGLLVRFVPFSKMIDWTINLTGEVIAPPSFSEEQEGFALFNHFSNIETNIDLFDETVEKINEPIFDKTYQKKMNYVIATVVNYEGDTI